MGMKNLSQIRTKTHHSLICNFLRRYWIFATQLFRRRLNNTRFVCNFMNLCVFCLTRMNNPFNENAKRTPSIHLFIQSFNSFISMKWVKRHHLCQANKVEFNWISSLTIYITVLSAIERLYYLSSGLVYCSSNTNYTLHWHWLITWTLSQNNDGFYFLFPLWRNQQAIEQLLITDLSSPPSSFKISVNWNMKYEVWMFVQNTPVFV